MPRRPRGILVRERSRSRSRSISKHSVERLYVEPIDYSDDSDTDCGPNKRRPVVPRGRRSQRGSCWMEGEERSTHQHIAQQNINLPPGSHRARRRNSRSRSVVILPDFDSSDEWTEDDRVGHFDRQVQFHHHGRDCAHMFGPMEFCPYCPIRQHPHGRTNHESTRGLYRVIQGEDGKMDMYNVAKVIDNTREAHAAWTKKQQDAKEVEEKKIAEQIELFSKVRGKQRVKNPPSFLVGHSSPTSTRDARGLFDVRSADVIRRELEQCDADLKQCREKAALIAQRAAVRNAAEVLGCVDAFCSGALKCDEETRDAVLATRGKIVGKRVRFPGSIHGNACSTVEDVSKENEVKHKGTGIRHIWSAKYVG